MELVGRLVAGSVVAFLLVTQLVRLAIAMFTDVNETRRRRIEWLRNAQVVVCLIFLVPIVFVRFRRGLIDYGIWEWLSWPLSALAILMGLLLVSVMLELEKESFGAALLAFLVLLVYWSFVIVTADMDYWIGS